MGLSSIYILDQKGRVLISRAYRADVPYNAHEIFQKQLQGHDEVSLKPILFDPESKIAFFHVRHLNLIVLGTACHDINAFMVFAFLHKFVDVLKSYLKEVVEESVRDNFVIIYELLDEMMDNGYPQHTDHELLKEYIKSDYHQLTDKEKKAINIPENVNNVVTWRKPNIVHKKNEVYMDVIEKLNMTVTSGGQVIKSEVIGRLCMRTYLSGMPEVKLGLNDKNQFEAEGTNSSNCVDLEDIKFHNCVRLARFENARAISFVPPDGEFDLMTYRVGMTVKPLFYLDVQTKLIGSTKFEVTVVAKALFKSKTTANDVEIHIPIPTDAFNPTFKTASGSVSYYPDEDAIIWQNSSFQGESEVRMKSQMQLPTIVSPGRDNYKKLPCKISFEIPYFTVSGINVRYLKVTEESGYDAVPWVRYMTESGEYFVRT